MPIDSVHKYGVYSNALVISVGGWPDGEHPFPCNQVR